MKDDFRKRHPNEIRPMTKRELEVKKAITQIGGTCLLDKSGQLWISVPSGKEEEARKICRRYGVPTS